MTHTVVRRAVFHSSSTAEMTSVSFIRRLCTKLWITLAAAVGGAATP